MRSWYLNKFLKSFWKQNFLRHFDYCLQCFFSWVVLLWCILFIKKIIQAANDFFHFVVAIFVTTIWRHSHFKSAFCSFVHAISTEVRMWRHFSLLLKRVFLFIRLIKFLVTLDSPHSKTTSSLWNWLLFTLIQRDKVKWLCHSKWRLFESS